MQASRTTMMTPKTVPTAIPIVAAELRPLEEAGAATDEEAAVLRASPELKVVWTTAKVVVGALRGTFQ